MHWQSLNIMYADVQNQKAVSAYFTSKQILPFGFAEQHRRISTINWETVPSFTEEVRVHHVNCSAHKIMVIILEKTHTTPLGGHALLVLYDPWDQMIIFFSCRPSACTKLYQDTFEQPSTCNADLIGRCLKNPNVIAHADFENWLRPKCIGVLCLLYYDDIILLNNDTY